MSATTADDAIDVTQAGAGERSEWNDFISRASNGHALQAFEWGDIKAAYGWRPIPLAFRKHGEMVGAALVLKRAVGPFSVLYAPKGPVLDYADTELASLALKQLVRLARRQRAIYIKIDPDIAAADESALALLRRFGFIRSAEQIQRPNTMMLDIGGSEEDVLGRMKPKWRYNIRLAEKKGVEIVKGAAADFPEFYRIYRETGERDGFIVRPYDYCRLVWQSYIEAGFAAFWLARYEGVALAGIMPFAMGQRMWYMFGASSNLHRNLMPNHALQWQAIRWGRERCCLEYDMWGAPDVLREDDPLWGVYLFKQGFGAQFVAWAGAHDLVLRPVLHSLWTKVVPAYVAVLRRLRGQRTASKPVLGA